MRVSISILSPISALKANEETGNRPLTASSTRFTSSADMRAVNAYAFKDADLLRDQIAEIAPPIVVALAKHPMVDNYDLSALKQVFSGAAPLSEAEKADLHLAVRPSTDGALACADDTI